MNENFSKIEKTQTSVKEILLRFENFRKFLTAPFVQSIAERILIRTQDWSAETEC